MPISWKIRQSKRIAIAIPLNPIHIQVSLVLKGKSVRGNQGDPLPIGRALRSFPEIDSKSVIPQPLEQSADISFSQYLSATSPIKPAIFTFHSCKDRPTIEKREHRFTDQKDDCEIEL
jgi:hypothetical protein